MEGFTIIDGVVALVIVVSALLAYSRGLVREVMAILGWVAAAVVAFIFAPQVEPLMREIPYVGEQFLADSCDLRIIAAFATVFAGALIVVSFFTPLFSSLVQRSALGGIDQGAGFLFGVARGMLLVAVAFFVYDAAITTQSFTIVDESRSTQVFSRLSQSLQEQDPQDTVAWVKLKFDELVSVCQPQ